MEPSTEPARRRVSIVISPASHRCHADPRAKQTGHITLRLRGQVLLRNRRDDGMAGLAPGKGGWGEKRERTECECTCAHDDCILFPGRKQPTKERFFPVQETQVPHKKYRRWTRKCTQKYRAANDLTSAYISMNPLPLKPGTSPALPSEPTLYSKRIGIRTSRHALSSRCTVKARVWIDRFPLPLPLKKEKKQQQIRTHGTLFPHTTGPRPRSELSATRLAHR